MDSGSIEKLSQILQDPTAMEKIRGIITGKPAENTEEAPKALPVAAEKNAPSQAMSNSKALLLALKPYLDGDRRARIDKIIDAIKLAEYARFFRTIL